VVAAGKDGGELVHDAALDADEVVLGALAELRQRDVVERQIERGAEGACDGDFERGGGGEAGALRHIAGEREIEAADGVAGRDERGRDAADVVRPVAGRGVRDVREVASGVGVEVGGVCPERVVVAAGPGAEDAAVDGEGEDEAVVVVDVLADQVDAAGRGGDAFGRAAELAPEGGDERFDALLVRRGYVRGAASRSSCAFSSGAVSLMKVPAPVSTPARYLSLSGVR
jgi:hypothetical protein